MENVTALTNNNLKELDLKISTCNKHSPAFPTLIIIKLCVNLQMHWPREQHHVASINWELLIKLKIYFNAGKDNLLLTNLTWNPDRKGMLKLQILSYFPLWWRYVL